ncbi:MAG: hypothetical protein K2P75_01495 [Sphingobacteriaceae bacterium]|nr:hypothetical protein [Sphingobacteriaceae bacterium]
MKKKASYIKRILTLVMLWVFSLAITPWSSFHHHQNVVTTVEKNCTHKLHVKAEQDHCLICKAHFEKNYTVSVSSHTTYLTSQLLEKNSPIVTSYYSELISTSLRGPPQLFS